MMLFVGVVLGILLGILICLLVQYYILKKWFIAQPKVKTPTYPQYEPLILPQELSDLLKLPRDIKQKTGACEGLNLLLQFLFSELKDTKRIRKWVMKRMDIEFEELLQTTTGKLVENITVRDFNLGGTFPLLKDIRVHEAKLADKNTLQNVCIEVSIDYSGGFQLAVDVDMVFGKSAYLSVKVTKLCGCARLEMTRVPYTHWTFAFIQEPEIEFEVDSHFEGRQYAQLTNIIINQIRRSIRRKHTLPNYKIRYKPFFHKVEAPTIPQELYCQGQKVSNGELTVTVYQCDRLVMLADEMNVPVYCCLSIDKCSWAELLNSRKKLWKPYETEIDKSQSASVGLTYKDELVIDRAEVLVVVEHVNLNSPAGQASIRKGDVVMTVMGNKVTNSKQLTRLIKQAPEKFSLHLERPSHVVRSQTSILGNFKYNENNVSLKDEGDVSQVTDEYVNISIPRSSVERSMDSQNDSVAKSQVTKDTAGLLSNEQNIIRQRRKDSLDSKLVQSSTENKEVNNTSTPKSLFRQSSSNTMKSDSDTDVVRTKQKSGESPVFNQDFTFHVKSRDEYLNVCVWCRVPAKLDKQNRLQKPEKDVLLGHVSIPLMDIALECMATLQGDYQQTYPITPPDSRSGAGRNKFSSFASHRGFDEALCHGTITLGFLHSTQPMSKTERRRLLLKIRQDSQEAMATQQRQAGLARKDSQQKFLIDGEHKLQSVKFTTATQCDLCHKKIWLKSGFQCDTCHIISHKKCIERCQTQTHCNKEGWTFKDNKEAEEYAERILKTKAVKVKVETPDEQVIPSEPPSTSKVPFLSRFKRDRGPSLTPTNSPPRKQANTGSTQSLIQRKLNVLNILERQRNSTYKAKEEPPPGTEKTTSVSTEKLAKQTKGEASESDTDEEVNLLRYYEKQKVSARSDEMVVTAAKETGRELYSYLPVEERKTKLDSLINKLQGEIDEASEHRSNITKQMKEVKDQHEKHVLHTKMTQADEKIQQLAVLMLHYCSGLQHCMEEIETGKQPVVVPEQSQPEPFNPQQSLLHDAQITVETIAKNGKLKSRISIDLDLQPNYSDNLKGNLGNDDADDMLESENDERGMIEEDFGSEIAEEVEAQDEAYNDIAGEPTGEVDDVDEIQMTQKEYQDVNELMAGTPEAEAEFEKRLTDVLQHLDQSEEEDDDSPEGKELQEIDDATEDYFSLEKTDVSLALDSESGSPIVRYKHQLEENCDDRNINNSAEFEGELYSLSKSQLKSDKSSPSVLSDANTQNDGCDKEILNEEVAPDKYEDLGYKSTNETPEQMLVEEVRQQEITDIPKQEASCEHVQRFELPKEPSVEEIVEVANRITVEGFDSETTVSKPEMAPETIIGTLKEDKEPVDNLPTEVGAVKQETSTTSEDQMKQFVPSKS